MANGDSTRVSVSLDTLRTEIRAALGEQELKIRDLLDQKLVPIQAAQDLFLRGEFTRAQESALHEVIDSRLDKRASVGLTSRKWRLAIVGMCIAFVSMVASAVYTITSVVKS